MRMFTLSSLRPLESIRHGGRQEIGILGNKSSYGNALLHEINVFYFCSFSFITIIVIIIIFIGKFYYAVDNELNNLNERSVAQSKEASGVLCYRGYLDCSASISGNCRLSGHRHHQRNVHTVGCIYQLCRRADHQFLVPYLHIHIPNDDDDVSLRQSYPHIEDQGNFSCKCYQRLAKQSK